MCIPRLFSGGHELQEQERSVRSQRLFFLMNHIGPGSETIQEVLDTMIKLADENITMVVVTHENGICQTGGRLGSARFMDYGGDY